MLIEIDGIGFANKGAEMMLRETVRRVRGSIPGASVAVSSRSGPYIARAALKLYQIPRDRRLPVDLARVLSVLPVKSRKSLGLVMNHEIDAVLDASGYKYSDLWGPKHVRNLARRAARSRQAERKFVLLPQAFGPFAHRSQRHLEAVVENVDLVYARDEVSYNHIVDLVGENPNVRIAPDFTATLPGFLRDRHEVLRGRFCLIPNHRMLTATPTTVRAGYVPLMRQCLRRASDHGCDPFVVIHETSDEPLACEIVDGVAGKIRIVVESDCRAVKGIIGVAGAVISSRFHGLVNALSQGVAALGTGWSHKYEMLFKDYGFPEGLIPVPVTDDVLEHRLSLVLDESSRARLVSQLEEAAHRQRVAIEHMWKEVFALLQGE